MKQDQTVTQKLQTLLADFWVLAMNGRNAHLNIEAVNFDELHAKFKSVYETAEDNADKVAERLRQLGMLVEHTMSRFLIDTTLDAKVPMLAVPEYAFKRLISDYEKIVDSLKAIIGFSSSEGDWSTNNMAMAICESMEKELWMLKSYKY